jgi:hypothetical protein
VVLTLFKGKRRCAPVTVTRVRVRKDFRHERQMRLRDGAPFKVGWAAVTGALDESPEVFHEKESH